MPVEWKIVVPRRALAKLVGGLERKLPDRLARNLRLSLGVAARRFAAYFTARRLSGRPGLGRRTGGLARRLMWEAEGSSLGDLNARVYFQGSADRLSWVWAHEEGATIRPRNRKFLTVPLKAAVTAAGVQRRRGATAWDNTFVARSRAGNLLIFQRRGKKVVPLYALKKEVKIPARLGFRDLGERRFVPLALARMQRALDKSFKEAFSG